MRRTRARLLACAIVIGAAGLAYASLDATSASPSSNPHIPDGSAGRIVFSLRNNSGGSASIVGFMAPMMLTTPVGCVGVTITPLSGTFPVPVGPGMQAQFVADATGFGVKGADSVFSCTWDILSNPAIAPTPTVTTTFFTVVTPLTPLDVQPSQMSFVVPSIQLFEQQQLVITNYQSPMNVNLAITGDDTTNILSFTNGPCSGHTCSMALPGGGGGSGVWIKCTPSSTSPLSAILTVTDTGGNSLGSAQLDCQKAGAGPTQSLQVGPNPIMLSGPQGVLASAPAMVTSADGGLLGSATIFSTDPTMVISDCMLTSCAYGGASPPTTIGVQCVPGATPTTGTLSVFEYSGGSGSSTTVNCSSTTSTPMLVVQEDMLSFSAIPVNQTSSPQTIHITNTGGGQLDNVMISFGTQSAHWQASACTTTSPCMIPSGSNVDITFKPTTHGDKQVSAIVSSSNGGTDSVYLMGTGNGGVMSVVTPPGPSYVLDIGTIPRGQMFSRDIVLANTGNAPYTATTSTPTAPYTIAPGPHQVQDMSMDSIAVTCQSATATATDNPQMINITSDAYLGSNASVQVRCKIADTLLQITPTMFAFGEVRVGTSPQPAIDITLTNPATSGAASEVTAFMLKNNTPGLSLSAPALPFSIAPGNSVQATLALSTAADTDLEGEFLQLTVDGTQLQFAVTGKVVTPHSRVVPPNMLDLGTACVGTEVTGTVMLINDGTATLAVEPPVMDQSFIASAPGTPAMLAPSKSLVASVTPAVSAMGPVTGLLTWRDDVPSEHQIGVSLDYVASGTALSPRGLDFGVVPVDVPTGAQSIKLQNCDLMPTRIKIDSLKTKHGVLGAWVIEPRVGFTKELAAKEQQAVTVTFVPPARGHYEADLTVETAAGKQIVHLVGDATGRDWDNTSFYACACNGPGAPSRGWPVVLAIVVVSVRRRRGSSSPR